MFRVLRVLIQSRGSVNTYLCSFQIFYLVLKNAEEIKQHHDSKDIIPKRITKRGFGKLGFKLNCRLVMKIFKKLKVAIIGPGGCGKSAIAVRILSRRYINEYCPTLEDTYHRILSIDGVKVGQCTSQFQIEKQFSDSAGCDGHK